MSELIAVLQSDVSKRLDVLVAEKTGITRSQVQKLLKEGHILVNNISCNHGYKIRINDVITFNKPERKIESLIPEPVPIKIFYFDDYLIVVDKPSNMVVYPSAGHSKGTLLNAVFYQSKKLSSIGGPVRNGIVHRLDKDTSGVMVIALDDRAYYGLIEQFKKRAIKRKYTAIVYGSLKNESGQIALEIGRSSTDRKKMSTKTRKGKEAITSWKVIRRFKSATLIEAILGTGRTHQIRVHFSSIGHPVLGDRVYGKKIFMEIDRRKISFPRQMLHADTLGFYHPITGNYIEFSSPLPDDFRECLEKLAEIGSNQA